MRESDLEARQHIQMRKKVAIAPAPFDLRSLASHCRFLDGEKGNGLG
jgi:hypothetical protein